MGIRRSIWVACAGIALAVPVLIVLRTRAGSDPDQTAFEEPAREPARDPHRDVPAPASQDGSPREAIEAPSAPSAESPSAEQLALFEASLFPKERARLAESGEDLKTYWKYKQASEAMESYEDRSLAYHLMTRCQAANPEIVYRRLIQPRLGHEPEPSTRELVDRELQQFWTAFNEQRRRLKIKHGLDVLRASSFAERTDEQSREKAMWEEMDATLESITCEWRLQALIGRPTRGDRYIRREAN